MRAVGLDVGGAHLKVALLSPANRVEWVMQLPCPLWQGLEQLSGAWREACLRMPSLLDGHYAVTMTGESADCFPSRNDGVLRILDLLEKLLPRSFCVYGGPLGLVDASVARSAPERVASFNWHASARLCRRTPPAMQFRMSAAPPQPCAVRKLACSPNRGDSRLRPASAIKTLILHGALRTPLVSPKRYNRRKTLRWVPNILRHSGYYLLSEELARTATNTPAAIGPPPARGGGSHGGAHAGCDATAMRSAGSWWREVCRAQYGSILSAYSAYASVTSRQTHPIVAAGVGRFIAKRIS